MKKLYYFLFTFLISFGLQGQIYSEGFESYVENTGIEGDGAGGIVNIGDYPSGVTQWTLDASNGNIFASSDWAKTVGGVMEFRDTDGAGGVIWESQLIDISSASGPVTFQLTASNNAGGFETSDFYNVSYSIDGAPFILIADWNGLGDASNTILGEKGGVDWNSIETITQSGITGGTLAIRVQARTSAGAETFYLDNISVFEGAPSPTLSLIDSPASGGVLTTTPEAPNDAGIAFTTTNFTVDVPPNGDGYIVWEVRDSGNNLVDGGDVFTTDGTETAVNNLVAGNTYSFYAQLVDPTGNPLVPAIEYFLTVIIPSYTVVTDIASLRADVETNGDGGYYEITENVLVTHTDGFNNRHWVQDNNIAGILITEDGSESPISTYTVGDNVSGLKGGTEIVNGVLRFLPTTDSGVVTSFGNPVVPQIVTIPQLNSNIDNYESELIEIENVTFVNGDGTTLFSTGTNYDVTDGANTIVKRTDFFSADYIGEVIPTGELPSVVAVAGEFNGTAQIYVRNLSDITLTVNDFELNSFSLYPNPTNKGFVTISTANSDAINVQVYDILGKQVKSVTLTDNKLNLENLKSGIYLVKITHNNASTTKKLVIK